LALLLQNNPELTALVEAWESLPEHIRAAVMALINYPTDAGIRTQFGRAWWSSNWYRGLLDDMRIYNRALSGTEVATLAAQ
jgi:hypothetical protein